MMACVYGTKAEIVKSNYFYDLMIVEASSVESLRRILEGMGLYQASYVDSDYFDTEEVWLG